MLVEWGYNNDSRVRENSEVVICFTQDLMNRNRRGTGDFRHIARHAPRDVTTQLTRVKVLVSWSLCGFMVI